MLNRTGITRTDVYSTNQILFHTDGAHSVGVKVNPVVGAITEHGKQLIKAGTPVYGDLTKRDGAIFEVSTTGASGVLLHDIDVTDTTEVVNATLLISGYVNLNRLDDATRLLITDTIKDALDAKVYFLTD